MNIFGSKKYKLFKNNILNEAYLYLLVIICLTLNRDTLISSIGIGFINSLIIQVFIIGVTSIIIIAKYRSELLVQENSFWTMIGFFVIILFSTLLKMDFQMYIISIMFYIYTAFLLSQIYLFRDFFNKFSDVMLILSIYSLIACYCLRPILFVHGNTNPSFIVVTNSANTPFFNLGLSYVVAQPYYLRNFSIFREPGVYQFFLLIPLIYELLVFEGKKIRWLRILSFVLSILSTFSPPGILVMGLIFVIFVMKQIYEKKMTKKNAIAVGALLLFIFLAIFILYFSKQEFSDLISQTIFKIFTINESSSARLNSLNISITNFLLSPLWGVQFSKIVSENGNCTNSTFSMMAIFGLFAGCLFTWLQYLFTKLLSHNKLLKISMLIVLIVMVNTQFLLGNIVFWIFAFTPFMIEDNSPQWSLKKRIISIFSWTKRHFYGNEE